MKSLTLIVCVLGLATGTGFGGKPPIYNVKLPQGGGTATPCIEGLAAPYLLDSQTFASFNGPFFNDAHAAEYVAATTEPVTEFRFEMSTTDSVGWQYYTYTDNGQLKVGVAAASINDTIQIIETPQGGTSQTLSVDLTPCEAVLQVGSLKQIKSNE